MQEKSEDLGARWNSVVRRRAFLKGLGVAGAMLPTIAVTTTPGKVSTRISARWPIATWVSWVSL